MDCTAYKCLDVMFQRNDVKEIQKYILLLLVLAVVAKVFPLLRDIYLAQTYGASDLPLQIKKNWEFYSLSFVALQNIASALWLRYLALKNELNTLVWGLFGLVFGLIAGKVAIRLR